MKEKVTEFLGWYGIIAILSAYTLISVGYFTSGSFWFQFLNLTGAIGVVIDAWQDRNIQPAVLNLIWAVIALISLFKIFS